MGPSGSGKTTLLNIVGSLDTPTEGEAYVLDRAVSRLNAKEAARLRKQELGFIFQSYNLLADEPTANLDAANSYNILQTMDNLNRELKTTFLFATHTEKVISYLHRKIYLLDGRVDKDEKIR